MNERERKKTVHWYDPDADVVVEAVFERRRATGAVRERLDKGGFDWTMPVTFTAGWSFTTWESAAPWARTEVTDPARLVEYAATALGMMIFDVMDRMPEEGFRFVTVSDDE